MLEFASLCRRAAFGRSDTGPMHLAVAVGTPSISMHGPSRADWCGAYGPQNIRMQIRYEAGSSMSAAAPTTRQCAGDHVSKWSSMPADKMLSLHAARKCG